MRWLDVTISLLALLLLSPLFVVIALFIKGDSRGSILYRSNRVGRNGKRFTLYKFRSMVPGAERLGPGVTSEDDVRITRVGRFLRRCKFDELPQFVNVLKGDMVLIGPRPENPRYVQGYTPEQRRVLSVRPGMTSWASLHYYDEARLLSRGDRERVYMEEVLPEKLAMELEWLDRRRLRGDLALMLRTLWRIVAS